MTPALYNTPPRLLLLTRCPRLGTIRVLPLVYCEVRAAPTHVNAAELSFKALFNLPIAVNDEQ